MVRSFLAALIFVLVCAPELSAAAVWFIDNSKPHGDGSAAAPFATLAAAQEASAPGDILFVFTGKGPYGGGITLKPGQSLIGQAAPLAPVLARAGIAAVTPPAIAARPVIEFIVCAGAARIDGIAVRSAATAAITGGAGDLELFDVAIDVSGSGDGVVTHGPLRARGGAITGNGSGAAIRLQEGSGAVLIDGMPIDRSNGSALIVRKRAGAIEFRNGSSVRVQNGKSDAIVVEDSTASLAFADPVTIVTHGARALVVKQAAKLSITSGSLVSTDATVVELRNTALDVTLTRVASSGTHDVGIVLGKTTGRFAVSEGGEISGSQRRGIELRGATGIVLRNIVLTGTVWVNGTTADQCAANLVSGDNLRCNAAMVLHDVDGITLENVRIDGSSQLAISGHNVHDATFSRLVVERAGDEHQEHALVFRNLTGRVRLTDSTISRPASRAIYVVNDAGSADITITGCRIADILPPHGMQGILVNGHGSAKLAVKIRGNTFEGIFSSAVYVAAERDSQLDVDVSDNRFDRTGGAVNLLVDSAGRMNFTISGNTATASTTVAFNAHASANATTATMSGIIARNKVSGTKCISCSAVSVRGSGTSTVAVNVTGNQIDRIDGTAIWAHADRRARLDVAVTSNALHEPLSAEHAAIRLQAGSQSADTAVVCGRIGGSGAAANQIGGGWDPRGAIQLVNRSQSTLRLPGLRAAGAATVTDYIRHRNRGAGVRLLLPAEPRAGAIAGGDDCTIPEIP